MMITTTEQLQCVCAQCATYPFVTLDTEFIREKTYWPHLCLIQLGTPDSAWCIDPLSDKLDLSALFDLLKNDKVVKVFHAARQDVEIFFHLSGFVPTPIFDTQIAAMVCGFGDSASYQQLVQELLNVSLDKSMRYTDWSYRPLSESQTAYALRDVTYLVDVYRILQQKLAQNGRLSWLAEEMEILSNPATYVVEDAQAWQRVKNTLTSMQQVRVFRAVCGWREKTAKLKNRPRRHIMKDECIQELAVSCPTTADQFNKMRSFSDGFGNSAYGQELLQVIQSALSDDTPLADFPVRHKALTAKQKTLSDLMRLLLSIVSDDLGVAPKVIAGSDDLMETILHPKQSKIMTGWRYDVFGQYVQLLKTGRLTFGYNAKTGKVFFKIAE